MNAAQPSVLRSILPPGGAGGAHGGMKGAGDASGTIVLWSEITVILASPLWGVLADRVGSRPVNVVGFCMAALGLVGIPNCGSIPSLTALRCLFAVGAAALGSTISSILADTVLRLDKGKGAALAGTASSFGAIFAALVLLRIPATVERMVGGEKLDGTMTAIRCGYYTAACFGVAAALVGTSFLYKGGCDAAVQVGDLAWQVSGMPSMLVERARQCRTLLTQDPGLALSLAASAQARGDASTVTIFLALWVFENSQSRLGLSAALAGKAAGAATGVVYTFSLIAGPPWGLVCDRLGDTKALVLASLLSGLSYSALSLVDNPSSTIGFAVAAAMGVAEIAMVISAQSMLARRSPAGARGLLGGLASLASGIGVLITGKVGGLAYDVFPGGPFLVQGLLSFGIAAVTMAMNGYGMLPEVSSIKAGEEESRAMGGMAALDSLQCGSGHPQEIGHPQESGHPQAGGKQVGEQGDDDADTEDVQQHVTVGAGNTSEGVESEGASSKRGHDIVVVEMGTVDRGGTGKEFDAREQSQAMAGERKDCDGIESRSTRGAAE